MIRITGPVWGLRELQGAFGGDRSRRLLLDFLHERYGEGSPGFLPLRSGAVGLLLGLEALGVRDGARVGVTAMCCQRVVSAIRWAGATPVYVDTEEGSFCLSPEALSVLLEKTPLDAVIAAHFIGQHSDMVGIEAVCERHGVPLIDDAAYLCGVRIGDRIAGFGGTLGIWGFSQKLLTGDHSGILLGHAGLIDRVADRLRGSPKPRTSFARWSRLYTQNIVRRRLRHLPECLGGRHAVVKPTPFRFDPCPDKAERQASNRQCALMWAQLHRVEYIESRIRRVYGYFREELAGDDCVVLGGLPHGGCFGRTVPIHWIERGKTSTIEDRLSVTYRIRRILHGRGVQSMFYAAPWYGASSSSEAPPHCEDLWPRTLHLPGHPLMSRQDVACVCSELRQAHRQVLEAH